MPKDFLACWKPTTADNVLAGGYTGDHAASNQFDRVRKGDTVWIVTLRSGILYLLTNIEVDQITDQDGAIRALGTSDLWEADYHIIAKQGSSEKMHELSLAQLTQRLRFESKGGKDKLTTKDGIISAQQLQTMRVLTPESAVVLREFWTRNNEATFVFPDEVTNGTPLIEGSVLRVLVNAYERNAEARKRCIGCYQAKCVVCAFDFEAEFGTIGKGFIHVHHLKPISQIGEDYEVDPIADLVPVCPNCHAMIHKRTPPYTIDEITRIRTLK